MENILPRREARENAFLLAFSQTFGDVPLAEALTNHAENDEEHPVDGFSKLLLNAYYDHSAEVDDEIRAHLRNWTMDPGRENAFYPFFCTAASALTAPQQDLRSPDSHGSP